MNLKDSQGHDEKINNQVYGLDQNENERLNFLWGLCHNGDLTINRALKIMEEEKQKEDIWVEQQIQEKTQKFKYIKRMFEEFSKINQCDASQDLHMIELSIKKIEDQLQNSKKWTLDKNAKLTLQDIQRLSDLVSQKNQIIIQRTLDQFKDTSENSNYIDYLLKLQQLTKFNFNQQFKFYIKTQILNKYEKVYASSFNYNGSTLVTATSNGLYFWKFEQNQFSFLNNLCTGTIQIGILFSKFQDLFVTYDFTGQFGVVKMIDGKWNLDVLIKGHSDQIFSIILQKNDKQIVTASQKNGIKFWYLNNSNTWNCQFNFELKGFNLSYLSGNNENYLASGSYEGNITIWQYWETKEFKLNIRKMQRLLCAHLNIINSIVFINKQQFVSLCYSSEIIIWQQQKSNLLFSKKQEIKFRGLQYWSVFTEKLVFTKNCNILFCCSGNQIKILKMNIDGNFELITDIIKEKEIYAFSVTQDGKFLTYSNPFSKKLVIRKANDIV